MNIAELAIKAGLGNGQGLNSDWINQVWFITGDPSATILAESVWLIDNEDGTYSITKRTLGNEDDETKPFSDNVYFDLYTFHYAEDAVAIALLIKTGATLLIETDTPTTVLDLLIVNADEDVEDIDEGDMHELACVAIGNSFSMGVVSMQRTS